MKKKFLLLFLEIISKTIIFCGFCGTNPPINKDYCGNYLSLNSTHRCCYCTNIETEKSYCLVVVNNKTIDGYTCDCDHIIENEDLPGASCLKYKETIENSGNLSAKFCHSLAIDEKHPCCFYDDGIEKRCFSIGKITSQTLYTYSEFLDCFSKNQKINIFLIFMILMCFL